MDPEANTAGENPVQEPTPIARAVGKRIKTAKVPFDPSPEVAPRRRQTVSSPKEADDGPTTAKKLKSNNKTDCDSCGTSAKDMLFSVCNMCRQTRMHMECLSRQGSSDNWQCKSCRKMVIRYEASIISSTTPADVIVPTVDKRAKVFKSKSPRTRKARRAGFAGFSLKELQRDNIPIPAITPQLSPVETNAPISQPDPKLVEHVDNKSEIPKISITNGLVELKTHTKPIKSSIAIANSTNLSNTFGPPHHKEYSPFGTDKEFVPNAGDWTIQQVFEYFHEFFPDASHVMQYLEIDGPALLLLKRQHMLKMVNHQSSTSDNKAAVLNLGTVLKMYSHVVRLQTQSNDIRLSWNVHPENDED